MNEPFRNRTFMLGVSIVSIITVVALVGKYFAPHDPLAIDLLHRFSGPTLQFPFGTDHLGRCLLSRLLYAAPLSLGISIFCVLMVTTIGVCLGVASGISESIDTLIMRVTDIFLAFPAMILCLAIIGALGPSLLSAVIGICASWWPVYARLVRSIVLSARKREFVQVAQVSGVGHGTMLIEYILPQLVPPLAVMVSLEISTLLLTLSALSFLGLGVQPPTAEWGVMLNEARPYFVTAPHIMWVCGGVLSFCVLGFNLVGEGLRDILNVRQMGDY